MSHTGEEFARLLAENEHLVREKVAVFVPPCLRVYKASHAGKCFTE